jgi:tetratricopeptide (TPR) repeat protein
MKDFKRLEERINKEKEITIGDITELGYSRYDINQFIEAGILSRAKRGLYKYLPEVKRVEEQPPQEEKEQVVEEQHLQAEETQSVEEQKHSVYLCVNDGMRKIMKRRVEEAIPSFEKALELEPNNSRAILGLIGAYVLLDDYEKAYTEIIRFYNTRQDNHLIYNIYYYLLLLKEHISIDENILNEIKNEIEENKDSVKKLNPNIKRLHNAINKGDYLEALKFANYSISIDGKHKKYHITNHIYKALIMSILKLKGIDDEVMKDNIFKLAVTPVVKLEKRHFTQYDMSELDKK